MPNDSLKKYRVMQCQSQSLSCHRFITGKLITKHRYIISSLQNPKENNQIQKEIYTIYVILQRIVNISDALQEYYETFLKYPRVESKMQTFQRIQYDRFNNIQFLVILHFKFKNPGSKTTPARFDQILIIDQDSKPLYMSPTVF